jgi:hypothetical protein
VKHTYPPELAVCVRERWSAVAPSGAPADVVVPGAGELPDPESLERLLSIAYQASLLREEERPVIFRMIVADPHDFPAEAGPPSGLHRLLFTHGRPLDAAELRRLSPAVKYHRTLIGVRADGQGGFEIWGILQSGPQWLLAAQGGRATPSVLPPSALVVRVTGPGLLTVTRGAVTVCALHGGRLSGPSADVFASRWLAEAFVGLRTELAALHIAERPRARTAWVALEPEVIGLVAPQMLKRLVTATRKAHHGGMLIIIPSGSTTLTAGPDALLRIKYEFREEEPRRRYRTLILAAMRALAASAARRRPAMASEGHGDHDGSSDSQILAAADALFELSSLIAALANVDGAVVLTERFELIGFGCEIGGDVADVTRVRKALDLEGTRWVEETTETVGTRHRAAYRLCQRIHDTLAIVVSQDGTVRLVAWKDGGVTYWDQLVDWPEG